MICHTVHLEYKPGEIIKVRPLADLHVGNAYCDEKAVRRFIDEDPECYFIGLGDLIDGIVVKDAKRYQKSSDGTEGDDIIDEQVDKLKSWLEPYKDRIWGLGEGNHEQSVVKHCGTNPVKRICKDFEIPFLGYSWFLRLVMRTKTGAGRTVIIRGFHGYGGGSRTQGADLTKYVRDIGYYEADIHLFGHVHRKQVDRIPMLGTCGNRIIAKSRYVILCGSFLRTLSKTTDPTYAEIKGYPPVELGSVQINIKPVKDWVKIWVDV